jgi:hypothetical protein
VIGIGFSVKAGARSLSATDAYRKAVIDDVSDMERFTPKVERQKT